MVEVQETRYIDEKKLNEITSRSLSSLRHDRQRGVGIPYVKIPGQRRVYYSLQDVLQFMEKYKIGTRNSMEVNDEAGN